MQTYEHLSEIGWWRVVQRAAHPRLRAYVHGYVASSSHLPAPIRERHLPSAEIALVVNFGAAHRRVDPAAMGEAWRNYDGAWIAGLHVGPQLCEAVGERHFMIVRFTPVGAHLFLGIPLHLLTGRVVALGDIDSGLTRLVMSCAGVASSWSERFAAIETLIAQRLARAAAPPVVVQVWGLLAAADGRTAVGPLVSQFDCNHRQLISQFQNCVGLAPKSAARLLRFNRALRLMNTRAFHSHDRPAGKPYIEAPEAARRSVAKMNWADLAADCGYFDQPHFVREFRQFAGTTPSSFLQQVASVD